MSTRLCFLTNKGHEERCQYLQATMTAYFSNTARDFKWSKKKGQLLWGADTVRREKQNLPSWEQEEQERTRVGGQR